MPPVPEFSIPLQLKEENKVSSTTVPTRRQRSPWWVLVGGGVAGAVGPGPIVMTTLGIFVIPITEETGFGRTVVTGAYSVAAVGMALGLPIVGRLMDRYALRPILVICWLGFTGFTALVGITPPNVIMFLIPYFFLGFFGAGTAITFAKALLSWFDNKRGMAIGLMAAVTGLGTSLTPLLATGFITNFGWRVSYPLLALVSAVIALTMILSFVRVRAERSRNGRLVQETVEDGREVNLEVPGLTVKEAFRSRHFWLIIAGLGLAGATIVGLQVNLVPMMVDRGLDAAQAGLLLTIFGLAALTGRLIGGFLLDRIHGTIVGAVVLSAPVIGLFFLHPPFASAAVAVAFIGFSFGIEGDLLNFFISRYLGMRSFGQLIGVIQSAFLLSTAFGPLLLGIAYDATGSYDVVMPILGGILIFCAICVLFLGRYTYPAVHGFDKVAAKDELAAAEILADIAVGEASATKATRQDEDRVPAGS